MRTDASDPPNPHGPEPPGDQRPEGPPASTARMAGAVRVVSGLTLLSRVGGLVRDVVTVRVMGDTGILSAFAAAFAIPNTFRRLFGEGALAAAFIPEYARALQDPDRAARFASLTIGLLTLATGLITILAQLALLLVLALTPADPDRSLSLKLIIMMLPFMPLICVAAALGGMLQVHGRFAPQAAQPIILNGLIIAAAVVHFVIPGGPDGRDPARAAYLMGGAAVLAGAVQLAWSLLELRAYVRWTRVVHGAGEGVRRMMRRYIPALIGMGTLQINALLDTVIAMWPVWVGATIFGLVYPMDEASAGVLFVSQRLYQFPLGVFGIAVATAVFPMLARLAADRQAGDGFARTLREGLRLSLFIGVPAGVGLWLVREPLVRVLFSGGQAGFSEDGLLRSMAVVAGYAPAIWAYSINHVLTRAFYARGDTATPVKVSVAMVALNVCLNLALIWPLREAGLAWSTAITAIIQCLILWRLSRRLIDGPVLDADVLGSILRTTALAAAMGAAVLILMLLWPWRQIWAQSWPHSLVLLITATTAGALVYGLTAWLTRAPELRWLLHPRARTPAESQD